MYAIYYFIVKHEKNHKRILQSHKISSRSMAIYSHMFFLVFFYYRVYANTPSLNSPYILVPTIGSTYSILYLFCIEEPTGN